MSLLGKAVVIVGMPRSGTTSVAEALEKLGVYFGKREDLSGSDVGDGGGWEHRQIDLLNRKLRLSFSQSTFDIDPIPGDWRDRPLTEALIAETLNLWDKNFSGRPLWGFKDPQVSAVLPFVRECFERSGVTPSIVICVRNPLDVASSSVRKHGTPLPHTLGGWLMSTLSALRGSRGLNRSIVIFSRLLSDPKKALTPVVNGLGLDPSDAEWVEAVATVNPEVTHGAAVLGQLDAYPAPIKETYALCLEAEQNPAKFVEGAYDEEVERIWSEWAEWRSFFARPVFADSDLGLTWHSEAQQVCEAHPYRPGRGWHTISAKTKAPAGTRVSAHLYPLPAIVWIRRSVWKHDGKETPAKPLEGRHGRLEEEAGMPRVTLFYGSEQVAFESPSPAGELELELEILIDTGRAIMAETFQELSRRALGE